MCKKVLFLFVLLCLLFACNTREVPSEITFSEHIAPIIYGNCSNCHRKGEAGGFDLVSYQDVASRGKLIKFVTQSRYMPPWPADASYSHFVDEKVLSQNQLELIAQWVDQGCKLGDSTKLPKMPVFASGSQLGTPNMVIKLRDVFKIKGNNKDLFLLMRVPFQMQNDTFVSAIEIVPDNRKLVHHINTQLLSYEPSKRKDVIKGEVVVDINDYPTALEAYKKLDLANDDGSFPMMTKSVTNYLPGVTPPIYPNGIGGFKMTKKGALFLKDIHYGGSRVDTTDQTSFNVFFAKSPPKRQTLEFQLGTFGVSPIVPPLVIPPDTVLKVTSRYTLPQDISVLTINPHMHLIGKSFWAYALLPNGDTIPLIRIKKWDFRWQYFYTFKKMLKLTRGTTIVAEGIYDNTRNNPNNPFSPPQLVAEREGSMRTTDEMFQFIITYLPYQQGDENISLEHTKNSK